MSNKEEIEQISVEYGKRATYDLEDRLLEYSASIVRIVESLAETRAGTHIGGQLLRSGTSPLFNHGEAQAAESQDDFIHKMSICLKELRESRRALRLIMIIPLTRIFDQVKTALVETDELIRIFVASIRTARNNKVREIPDEYVVQEKGKKRKTFDIEH